MRRRPLPCRPWCHSGTPFVHSGCVLRQWTSSGCRNFGFGESTRGHIGPGSMDTWATGPATAATAAGFRIQVGISPTRRWATMSSSLESSVLELLWIREWPSLHVWRCRSHAPHIVRAPKARVGWAYTHFSLDWFGATSSGVCRQPTSPCSMASLAPTDDWVACKETGGFGHRHARSTSEMPAASERPPFELLSLQFGVICLETLPWRGEDRPWANVAGGNTGLVIIQVVTCPV